MTEPIPVVVGEDSITQAEPASQTDTLSNYHEMAETDDSDNETPGDNAQETNRGATHTSISAKPNIRRLKPSSAAYVNDPFDPEDFRSKANPCKCVAILGFGSSADAPAEVYKVMKQFGQIESVEFARNRDGTSKGYGFVFYRSLNHAKKAVDAANMKGLIIFHRRVRVDYSTSHASGVPVVKNLPASITGKASKSEKQAAKKSATGRDRSRDRSHEKSSSRPRSRSRDHGRSRRRSRSRDRDRRRERSDSRRRDDQHDTNARDKRRNRDSRRDRSRSNDRSSRGDSTAGPASQSIPSIVPLLSKKPQASPSNSAPSHVPGYPPSLLPPPGYFNPAMYAMAGPHPFMVPSIVYGPPSVPSLVPNAPQQNQATSLPLGQEWSSQGIPTGAEYATQEHRSDQSQPAANWAPGYASGSVNAMPPQQVAWMAYGGNQPQTGAASYQQYQQPGMPPLNVSQHSSNQNQGPVWNQQSGGAQPSSTRPPGSDAGLQHVTYQQQFPTQQSQGQQGNNGPYNGVSQPQQNGQQATGSVAYMSGPMQGGYSMSMHHHPHVQYE